MKYGIVSGYWNPIHKGHIDYIESAKQNCDFLFCITNNDKQVEVKQSKKFMNENERERIVSCLKFVDQSVLSVDTGISVAETLEVVAKIIHKKDDSNKEIYFFNSGDRDTSTYNSEEMFVCKKYNIKTQYLDMPKVNSSSWLLNK